jgi:exopolysaccharide biosynthesis polyprenyl glycosylphosphotransferase
MASIVCATCGRGTGAGDGQSDDRRRQTVCSGRGLALVRRDLLIVGADATAREMRNYLASLPGSGYHFRGFISTAASEPETEVAGQLHELVDVARAMFVDEVIVCSQPSKELLSELCEQARQYEIDLRYVPDAMERQRVPHEVRYIGSLPTIVAYERPRRSLALLCKRVLDLAVGSLALVLLSPVFLAVAIAIRLQTDGSVLYCSERVGARGRGFTCYKFRTMVRDADSRRGDLTHLNERSGVLFKISNDPRVTPLGAWLRKYSLDELPQLFNVLRGEMSLVGPRPSLRCEVAQYQTAHFRRLDVLPGMTGLWQVEARSDPSFDSYVALDSKYVNEWSLWLDLKLLLRTVYIVFRGTGV